MIGRVAILFVSGGRCARPYWGGRSGLRSGGKVECGHRRAREEPITAEYCHDDYDNNADECVMSHTIRACGSWTDAGALNDLRAYLLLVQNHLAAQ